MSAEKTWTAALLATNAFILARTGEEPEPNDDDGTHKRLLHLYKEIPDWEVFTGATLAYPTTFTNRPWWRATWIRYTCSSTTYARQPTISKNASGWRGLGMAMPNALYYGDNPAVLRERVADESVDLVYLAPPFNSNASYNVLFREKTGEESPAQIRAFTDTWEWTQETELTLEQDIIGNPVVPAAVKDMISAFRQFIGRNDMMAYLVMIAPRLVELRRVLKSTGSIYLHCDPTAGHYLKILMDTVFNARNYRNEISWRRTNAHNDAKQGRRQYGNVRDTILFYTKSSKWTWNWQYTEYDSEYVDNFYKFTEPDTERRYQMGDLTAAKPDGDTSYEWRVKRPKDGDWEADLTDKYLTPVDDWEYKGVLPYRGRYWGCSKAGMIAMSEEGRLAYAKGGVPRYKRYLDEMPGVPLQND